MSKKLKKYVKRELRSGSSREQVEKTLVSAGWEEEEVQEALSQVMNNTEVSEPDFEDDFNVDLEDENDKLRLVLLILVFLAMALLALGIFMDFTSFDPRMVF